jgi:hypothetical protein
MVQNRIGLKLAALIAEMTDTKNHSELMVIASKIVDLYGRCDSANLTDAEIWEAALEIVRRQQYGGGTTNRLSKAGGRYDRSGDRYVARRLGRCLVYLVARWLVGKS